MSTKCARAISGTQRRQWLESPHAARGLAELPRPCGQATTEKALIMVWPPHLADLVTGNVVMPNVC
ncbi:hypothetical protein ACIBCN_00285 [Nocardia sp. NPDC051052]|uniref:hypothetical protein n=1 Tax=Nocardia sp. NPDC051052 TaxID=3364322 RepID=UPI0037AF294E